ncbi:ATP-binding cassette domain-containing protein [Streptobacillus moniliformis]|uniref:ATP-binding cassette domain-containing protein n=1 Tax=Streptobacillus moniliformis TaxID=34105 RepID=UPI0007E30241|nr:ABC transporter ATP-binding protein [Streptobacillus moniliformis]
MQKNILKLIDKKIFFLLVIFRLILSLHNAIVSYLMKVILDEIFNKNVKTINIIFLIIIVITLFHAYIYYIYSISLEKMKKKLMENITFNIVNKYLRNSNDDFNLGNFTTLINEDVYNLSDYLMYGFFPILDFSIMLIVGFVYISFFSFKALFLYLFIGLIFLYYSKKNYNIAYVQNTGYYEKEDKHKAYFESLIKNIPILQVYNILKWTLSKHNLIYKEKMKEYDRVASSFSKMDNFLTSGIYFVQILTFILGIHLVSTKELTLAEMISIWNIGVGSIIYVFIDLFPIVDYMIIQKTSIERIEKHIFLKDENDIENICFSDDVEGIKGEDINFSYDDKNVLENLSFNFPNKRISYILGENGSGKSTLLKLLLNELKLNSGKIYTNIHNLKFTFISQKNTLFTTSIYENICLGKKLPKEKLYYLLEKLNLLEVIDKLPNGLNSIYNEEINLSGGEIRRIAIARAILNDFDYIILDEPFSDLDKVNQDLIMEYLLELKKEKGIIIITHTTDMILESDNVLRLGDSK